jgi:PAS domain S-box-containing protein
MTDGIEIQRILRAVPGSVLLLKPDADFTIVAGSAAYLTATHTTDAIFGRPLFEVFPDNPELTSANGSAALRASLQRVLATRCADVMAVQRYDVRRQAADGGGFEERYWRPANTPILRDDGEVDYILHHVEEAAARAKQDAIGILESITEGFFTLDRQWRFDYVNSEAHRILGRAPGELTGRVLWQAYPGLEGTDFERAYLRTMHRREKGSFTAYYAGHDRWYEVTTFPAAEGMSIYFRDVSEQKRMQTQRDALMAESERQRRIFETALDSTPDFVYVFDLDHRALYANAALLKTWGVDDVRGKRWMDLGYEQWHADLHDRELDQVIATRAPIRGEIPFTGTNGTRIYDYIFAPVLGADGEVVAVAGTTRDVTERQRLALRMVESQRLEAIGTLAGGVAHDFNNMLAAILGNVALAKQELEPTSPALGRLHLVHRAAERARALVRQILTFSRRAPQQHAVLALQPLVDEAIELLRSTLPPTVRLSVHSASPLLWARVDGPQFQQIVVNLCTNAWQALPKERGEVRVSVARVSLSAQQADALELSAGEHVLLQVADSGLGMNESVRSRIFEPFFTTKPPGQGTGLGLAVVHGVITESGGAVRVESEPGRGTCFSVYLPLLPEPAAELGAAIGPSAGTAGSGGQVLYVDDDEVVSLTAAALLSKAGHAVSCAHDGPAALSALRSAPRAFDVVITDFNMPGMSGLAVAEAVRSQSPGTQVIVISGMVTDELQASARAMGVREVLPKEEMLERLVDAVRRAQLNEAGPDA